MLAMTEKYKTIIKWHSTKHGLDWTGQLDWTVGLDNWTGQLDWTAGLDSWTGLLDWNSFLLLSFQLKCSSNIDSIHFLRLKN